MNPYLIDRYLREKKEEEFKEVERRRLLNDYNSRCPSLLVKICWMLGATLIHLGEKLKHHYCEQILITNGTSLTQPKHHEK